MVLKWAEWRLGKCMQRIGHGLFYCTVTISVCRDRINVSEQQSYRSRVAVGTPHTARNYRLPLYITLTTNRRCTDKGCSYSHYQVVGGIYSLVI
jgi:hypothetical protein